jgi:Flp pilus assembly protein TadB
MNYCFITKEITNDTFMTTDSVDGRVRKEIKIIKNDSGDKFNIIKNIDGDSDIVAIVFIFGVLPALVFGMIMFSKYQKRKLAEKMIEKGMDPSTIYKKEEEDKNPLKKLRNALIMVSLGLAFFLEKVCEWSHIDMDFFVWFMLFMGASFMYVYYKSTQIKNNDQDPKN